MRASGLAAAAAALAVVFGASAGSAQAAPTSGLAQAPIAPAAQTHDGKAEQARWRGHRRHWGGFGITIGPGIGFYAGRGYPYYGYRNYYRPYGYRSYGYTNRRCYWSSRLHRRVCRW